MNHHFPAFHLRPMRGYVNDPNGPVMVDGTLHLYFQSRQTTDTNVPVQWGHATSSDFVRWQIHRPAMTPLPGGLDRDGCFSGNTIRTHEGIRAFYSGNVEGKRHQSTLTALSTDGGYSFGEPSVAVADPEPHEGVVMLRDPFVWNDGDTWRMAIGAELEGELAAVRHYRSSDLSNWTFEGNLVQAPRQLDGQTDTGAGWECPQVVSVGGHEVVLISTWAHIAFAGKVLAVRDGSRQIVDAGSNLYAASAMRTSDYGPVMFGWLTEGCDPSMWQERGWAGAISLPRVLSLGSDGRLLSDPIATVDSLRTDEQRGERFETAGAAFELRLPHVSGTTRIAFGDREWMDVDVDVDRNRLSISRDNASADPRAHRGVMTVVNAFDPVRRNDAVRLFVDGSIVEAFSSSGDVVSTRVYPTTAPPWTIETPSASTLHHLSVAQTADSRGHARGVDLPEQRQLASTR